MRLPTRRMDVAIEASKGGPAERADDHPKLLRCVGPNAVEFLVTVAGNPLRQLRAELLQGWKRRFVL